MPANRQSISQRNFIDSWHINKTCVSAMSFSHEDFFLICGTIENNTIKQRQLHDSITFPSVLAKYAENSLENAIPFPHISSFISLIKFIQRDWFIAFLTDAVIDKNQSQQQTQWHALRCQNQQVCLNNCFDCINIKTQIHNIYADLRRFLLWTTLTKIRYSHSIFQ